jgi:hypothetical protein
MNKPEPVSNRDRVAKRRAALRAQGLRPKQIWVPDLRRPEVREQIRREVEAIVAADRASGDQAFIDAITCWEDLPPYDAPLDD